MDIGDQYAKGDIYNIGRMDLNGGTFNAETVYLKGSAEDIELLSRESQTALAAQFKISYLDFIVADNQKKFLIDRQIIKDIQARFDTQMDLPLIGIPGVGKTCLLYQLSTGTPNVIYLPIAGKSLLTVVAHLVNKINLASGLPLIKLIDAEAGLEILQGLLLSSNETVMIDDCESNPEVVSRLLSLRKMGNRFIYASRNEFQFINNGIEPIRISSFSYEEMRVYLKGSQISLDVLTTNELFEASQGNPLYLYYFTQYQIHPLPKNIIDYHHAIWGNLTPKQQHCLIYIALSYKPLGLQVIVDMLPFDFPTEADDFINSLIALIKNENNRFEIFHAAFKEYIVEKLTSSQLINQYQKSLGEYYLKENEGLQAAHLLLDHQPQSLENIANDIVHQLINDGDLTFATRVMLVMLDLRKTNFEKGYLHYHLAFNFKMLNNNKKAEYHQEQSLSYFNKLKDRSWYNASLMNKATSMVEDGKLDEGLAIADKVLARSQQFGPAFEGQLLVNVSKIYVDIHENEKAAKASLKAYRSFEKQDHVFGMLSSLINLASALAKLSGYEEVAVQYADKILEFSNLGAGFNLELIALNILTSVNRVNGNYTKAKEYGQRAVMLCQHYKLENKAILNLINYANVLRDADEIEESLIVYHEALIAANRLNLIKDESRIYWILADISASKKDFGKAIEHIDASIRKSTEISYKYGIAHGYEDKARIYQKMGDLRASADNYALSTEAFSSLADFTRERSRTLQKAILLYLELGLNDEANRLFKDSATILQNDGFYEFNALINDPKNALDIHSYFKLLTSSYLKLANPTNLIREYIMYLEYCLTNLKTSKKHFNSLLLEFALSLNENRFARAILAVLIEQSKSLMDGESLTVILKVLSTHLAGFHAREIVHESILLIRLEGGFKLEIIAYTEDLITLKLGIAQSLFLLAAPELLIIDKPRQQDFCKVHIFMLNDFKRVFTKVNIPTKDDRVLTYHLQKDDHQVPNFITINERYETAADMIADINNKHFMYFLGASIRTLITGFYHLKPGTVDHLAKHLTRKIAFLLGLTGLEEIKAQKEAYAIDLEKLEGLVENYFTEDGRIG
ncbi:tetratricopeptide repeat protein [Mucilaginibacter sp. SJ]|uniref:tetratricopeptide repeat protein n=1 Tax=Mucilaginibacter sp. SJ TaxID=3029053 RepID=UPI0023A9449D|nr:hypothetical protein [Mucilaginibacter sp. SJ]WEA00708.1 hypothetical protein MusilaSJ_24960 [Mucilaginibacter sp. SJ]